jgi:hypothetical protein
MKQLTTNYQLQATKKGVSLYLALIIMFILIAIGLGVSLIIVSQMKMMKGMGDSVVAFYAADTGIENSLYEKRKIEGGDGIVSGTLVIGGANAEYNVTKVTQDSTDYWRSVGNYQKVKRAIEIKHPAVFDFAFSIDPNSGLICPAQPVASTTVTASFISGIDDKQITFYTDAPSDKIEAEFVPISGNCSTPVPPISCICTPPIGSSTSCEAKFKRVTGAPAGLYNFYIYGETTILAKKKLFNLTIADVCPW